MTEYIRILNLYPSIIHIINWDRLLVISGIPSILIDFENLLNNYYSIFKR
jgi:hypothetical protein